MLLILDAISLLVMLFIWFELVAVLHQFENDFIALRVYMSCDFYQSVC